MNALLIYDSQSSTIKLLAQTIGGTLHTQGPAHLCPVEETSRFNLETIDMLVVGCPTQSFGPTPALLAYLASLPPEALKGIMAAAFDIRARVCVWDTGSAAWSIADHLERLGATLLSPPESFFVADDGASLDENEVERAAQWASALLHSIEANLSTPLYARYGAEYLQESRGKRCSV
jgi:flavodoxin